MQTISLFDDDASTLAKAVVAQLRLSQQTLATAESLTGGLLGGAITAVAGASAVFVGGFVTYTDAMKQRCLGVPEKILEAHGAVSEPVARAMAEGALRQSGATCALSTTGVAGPDGGTKETPVGTVWIGLAREGQPTVARRFVFAGDRALVRRQAVVAGLGMVVA